MYFKLGMDKNVIVPYRDYLEAMKPDFDFRGNQNEIKDLVRCLFLPKANSVKLVGRRGVGVTALVDGLVQHQQSDFMPDEMMTRPIYRLNGSSLFNTSDSKAIEARFNTALDKLKKVCQQRQVKPILVVDDGVDFISNAGQHVINTLVEADITANYIDIIVGIDEKRLKDFDEKHPEFLTSFTTKKIEEPSNDVLYSILEFHAKKHEQYGVIITKETLSHLIDITQRFQGMYDTAQPNRSIRLLDSAATAYRLEIHSRPPKLQEKMAQLEELNIQMSRLVEQSASDDEITHIKQKISDLTTEIDRDKQAWEVHRTNVKEIQNDIRKFDGMIAQKQADIDALDEETKEQNYTMLKQHFESVSEGDADLQGRTKHEVLALDQQSLLDFAEFDMNISRNPKVRTLIKEIDSYKERVSELQKRATALSKEVKVEGVMTDDYVEQVASEETKTPVGGITGQVNKNIRNGVALMKETVFGQDEVIENIIESLRRSAAGMGDPNRPLGVFMIAGPPGNGKTYTGEQLAKKIFGSDDYCRIIPMGSYREKHAVSKLISAPPGYSGYEDKALFAEIGQQMPFGVLILDEIEKAHPDIRQAMLEILSTGKFEALNGDKADFRNIIILSTSNYAQDVWLDNDLETGRALFMDRIHSDVNTFSPEYLDRHDAILCTGSLSEHALQMIVQKEIKTIQKISARKHPELYIQIEDEDIVLFTREQCLGKSGRHAARRIRAVIGSPLSDIKLDDTNAHGILVAEYDMEKADLIFDYQRGLKPELQ